MQPRPYQVEAELSVGRCFEKGYHSPLTIMATGLGKTLVAHNVIRRYAPIDVNRTLFLAHLQDLTRQTKRVFSQYSPEWTMRKWTREGRPGLGIVMGELDQADARVIIGTPQTLSGTDKEADFSRLNRVLKYGKVDMLVVDESHMSIADGYMRLVDALRADNPRLKIAGYTATPWRSDGKGLNNLFDVIACNYNLRWGINHNFLCPILDPLQIETNMVYEGHTGNEDELARAIDVKNWSEIILKSYLGHGENRLALSFMPSVEHSRAFTRYAQSMGVPCAHVDSSGVITPDGQEMGTNQRYAIYDWFQSDKAGDKPRILSNYNILTTGVDFPAVSCLLWARPTISELLMAQCLSTDTEILTRDKGWATHDQVHVGDVVASYDTITRKIVWQTVTEIFFRPVAQGEKMATYEGIHVNFRVTEGHRMLYSPRIHAGRAETFIPPKFITAGDLSLRSEVAVPVAAEMDFPGVDLTDDELVLLGFWLADGNQKGRKLGMTLVQDRFEIAQSDHKPTFAILEGLIKRCGFLYQKKPRTSAGTPFKCNGTRYQFCLPSDRFTHTMPGFRQWGHLKPYMDKNIPEVYDNLTRHQFQKLLEGLNYGDGSKLTGVYWQQQTYTIVGKGKGYAERFQALAIVRGIDCTTTNYVRKSITKGVEYTGDIYWLRFKDQPYRAISGTEKADRESIRLVDPLIGENVWCVSVPNETLVTRRNGKPLIVGNCIGRGTRLHPSKENLLILDFALKGLKLVSATSITGLAYDAPGETAEKEVDELIEGQDIRDAMADKGETLISGEGVVVKIGKLMGHSKNAWFCNDADNTMSLACGDANILVMLPPFYTLGRRIEEGLRVGEAALEKTPDNAVKQTFYRSLQTAHEIFNNYTLWQVKAEISPTGVKRWKVQPKPLLIDDNPMSLFDRSAPIEDSLMGDDSILTKKHKQWRRKPPSDKQLTLLRHQGFLETPESMGIAAQMITHYQAAPKVMVVVDALRDSCKVYGNLENEMKEKIA